jgi:hypothetical protein
VSFLFICFFPEKYQLNYKNQIRKAMYFSIAAIGLARFCGAGVRG